MRIFSSIFAAMVTCLFYSVSMAGTLEFEYRDMLCMEMDGITEYRLDDGTRVDCLTETHAWEVDRAHKWAEAIGQALHYAHMTERRAGILLFDKGADRMRQRIEALGLPIDVLIVEQ
jgi:hypothetical protein